MIQQISVSSTSFQSVFWSWEAPHEGLAAAISAAADRLAGQVVWKPLLGFVSTPPEQRQWLSGGRCGRKAYFLNLLSLEGKQEPDLDSNAYALLVLRMVLPAFSSWGKLTLSVGFRPPIYVIPKFFIARQHHWGLYQPLWLEAWKLNPTTLWLTLTLQSLHLGFIGQRSLTWSCQEGGRYWAVSRKHLSIDQNPGEFMWICWEKSGFYYIPSYIAIVIKPL